jgi:peptide/nickel transport system permease protein
MVVFLGARALPGDAALAIVGVDGATTDQAQLSRLRAELGLDDPLPVQYLHYVSQLLHGNFGISTQNGLSVGRTILERLPVTAELIVLSVLVGVLIATIGGTLAALRRGRVTDVAVNTFAMVNISTPEFWRGLMLIIVFAIAWPVLPASGFTGLTDDLAENIKSMVLPVVTIGVPLGAFLMRQVRTSMVEAMLSDYIRTARAKGMPRRRVWAHALVNCLIPLITMVGLQTGALITGTLVAEQLFVLPGLGSLLLNAVNLRDYAVIQGVALVLAIGYVLVNLVVDILYFVVDPRVRQGS